MLTKDLTYPKQGHTYIIELGLFIIQMSLIQTMKAMRGLEHILLSIFRLLQLKSPLQIRVETLLNFFFNLMLFFLISFCLHN